jgi:hypothetical protein
MSMFGENGFDANAPENKNASNVIPAGDYQAVIVASEKKANTKGTGSYLKLEIQITGGEFQNRRLFENINLWLTGNDQKTQDAVKIAKAKLSELCRAVNVLNPKESAELHGKAFSMTLGVRDAGEYGMQNNIKKFKPRTMAAVPTPPAPPANQPAMARSAPDASPFG